MKLFAQHGYGEANKIDDAVSKNFIDGIIFSPRDITREKLKEKIKELPDDKEIEILFDPQLYVSPFENQDNLKKRYLDEWNYYQGYRINELELSENIDDVLRDYYGKILSLNTTSVIAPNIYISDSFESREAVISKNFIRKTSNIFSEFKDERKVYASLIIDWEALLDNKAFEEFLDDLSLISDKPDGIYLIVGSKSLTPQESFYVSEVVSAWMKINYALSLNGYNLINGYSDIMTPLLGAVGANAGATGWWSNLRYFKMERFLPQRSGGRMPIKRYLSVALFNRIKFDELEAFERFLPEVLNSLSCDAYYDPEPETRDQEMLQSWEGLRKLIEIFIDSDVKTSLSNVEEHILEAQKYYSTLKASSLTIDRKSNDEHLDKMLKAISEFKQWAQIQ